MSKIIKHLFPTDIHNVIKVFTGEAHWRNGRFVHCIPKDDPRYNMLKNMPKIKQVPNDTFGFPIRGSVWFKMPNGKFTVITVRKGYVRTHMHHQTHDLWEMHYNQTRLTLTM